MVRVLTLLSLCVLIVGNATAPLEAKGHGPLQLGSRLELFVDDFLIERVEGLTKRLHAPVSAGKFLELDKPWEGNTCFYTTVFRDGDRYLLYYRGSSDPTATPPSMLEAGEEVIPKHPEVACVLVSSDGIRWERPSVGIHEFNGSRDNNIVWTGRGTHNLAPMLDPKPGVPESERFKALCGGPLLALKSADGYHWEKMQEEPVISDGAFDSLNIPVWDHVRGRYLAIYRDFTEGVRTIKIAESDDFLNWTPGEWGDFGDAPLEHLYTNGTAPYIRAPHIFLGFPKRFHPWRNQYPDSPRPGISDAVLMSSRDGYHWRRHLEAFVRPGRDPRNWLNRNNLLAAGTVLTAPDELSLYMLRNYKAPSLYLERMVLRTDGFVSMHAGHGGGEFVTKPLVFEGSNLVLNFATSAAGSIHVEIQDAQGQVLPSFGLAESPMIWGDEIEHVVRWERDLAATTSDNPLRRIAGKAVRLRFVMKDADLYSIRFR